MHGLCLTTFAVTVLPEMPSAIARACTTPDKLSAAPLAVPADGAASQATQGGAFVHLISAGLASLDNGPSPVEAKHAAEPVEVSASATLVATVATTATRRLQEMVAHVPEPHAACARTTRLFDTAVPTFIYAAVFIEMGLFVSAMSTAKAASRLLMAARRYGANAI